MNWDNFHRSRGCSRTDLIVDLIDDAWFWRSRGDARNHLLSDLAEP